LIRKCLDLWQNKWFLNFKTISSLHNVFVNLVKTSVVNFNPISTNQVGFQPKKNYFGLQPNGYNPSNFNPVKYVGL
jgi:hypothetical protein